MAQLKKGFNPTLCIYGAGSILLNFHHCEPPEQNKQCDQIWRFIGL